MTQPLPPDDIARLEALRARLEAVLNAPETTPRDLATVAREYRILVTKLAETAPVAGKSSPLDEIAAARRNRRGA